MIFKKLELTNYRNLENEVLEFDSGINIIFGPNAQGKTNILESLWLFTGAKSFRGSKDSELIKFNCSKAKLKLNFYDGRDQNCVIEIEKSRTAILNEVELGAASNIAGKIYAIVFSPNDLLKSLMDKTSLPLSKWGVSVMFILLVKVTGFSRTSILSSIFSLLSARFIDFSRLKERSFAITSS